jgi:hypothetical protein
VYVPQKDEAGFNLPQPHLSAYDQAVKAAGQSIKYPDRWASLPEGVSPAAYALANGVSPSLIGAFLQSAYTNPGKTPAEVVDRFKNPNKYRTPEQIAAVEAAAAQWRKP